MSGALPNLSLYIHIPWCIRKCPYCDFNSHVNQGNALPEAVYLQALKADLAQERERAPNRQISTIFIGGGTPSLMSGAFISDLLAAVGNYFSLTTDIEITLEANPGASELSKFKDFYAAGVNRLSVGVQSFHDAHLQRLGRVHSQQEAKAALAAASEAGFKRLNCDLMYNLPQQTVAEAMADLEEAIASPADHISWYQLTIEPNTAFYRAPPEVPNEGIMAEIETQGLGVLAAQGYQRYEISAFTQPGGHCQHNLNYWQFGDYLAVGAGAHGKITDWESHDIQRYCKFKTPRKYMATDSPFTSNCWSLHEKDKRYEYMLNACRLVSGFTLADFMDRTGLEPTAIQDNLASAQAKGLIEWKGESCRPTDLGLRFLNDLINHFID